MDAILQESFQNMESAINALVDSMTTYNPSTAAVHSLQSANEQFSASLATLSEHQANHARIVRLRALADALDEQVRQAVRALADARGEVVRARGSSSAEGAGPEAAGEERARPVGHVELLRYAKAIAKFTVPPSGFRVPDAAGEDGGGGVLASTEEEGDQHQQQQQQRGERASASTPPQQPQPRAVGNGGAAAPATGEGRGVGWATLPEGQRAWLDQAARGPFVPWPAEDTVRAGGLSAMQALVEEGRDPAAAAAAEAVAAAGEEGEGGPEQDADVDMNEEEPVAALPAAERERGRAPRVKAEAVMVDFGLFDPDAEA